MGRSLCVESTQSAACASWCARAAGRGRRRRIRSRIRHNRVTSIAPHFGRCSSHRACTRSFSSRSGLWMTAAVRSLRSGAVSRREAGGRQASPGLDITRVRAVVGAERLSTRRTKRGPAYGPQGGNAATRPTHCGSSITSLRRTVGAGSLRCAPRVMGPRCNARLHGPDHRVAAPGSAGPQEFVLIQHKALARS